MFYSHRNKNQPIRVCIGDEEVELPFVWEICDVCRGNGGHSLRFGAISGERLEEMRQDEEFCDAYFTGQFDEKCEQCQGSGKIRAPDMERLTPEQKKAWEEDQEAEAEMLADQMAEYRMSEDYRREVMGYG